MTRKSSTLNTFGRTRTGVSVNEEWGNAEPLFFKNEFVVDLTQASSMDLAEQLDCYYVWIEVVDTNPPDSKKMKWLPRMLSKRWLILIYGYGESFTPKRPDTYEGKMTEDETKKVLDKLIQQLFRLKQQIKAEN